jgi:hypothetical protein
MTSHPDKVFGPDRPAGPLPAHVREMLKSLDVATTGSTPDGWPYDPIALAEAIATYHADLCALHDALEGRYQALRAEQKAFAEEKAQFMAQRRAATAVKKLEALDTPTVDGTTRRFNFWR